MSSIEWTDVTWNPVRGCSRVSPGCQNCYAEKIAARFSDPPQITVCLEPGTKIAKEQPFHGFATRSPARWTGRVELISEKLGEPLCWKTPRRVFVNSMSDLFHEDLAFVDIAAVFGAMASAPQHTFQVLTKRPERMLEFFEGDWRPAHGSLREHAYYAAKARLGSRLKDRLASPWDRGYPLSNVWLGVSCEDQKRADERIPLLLKTPAAVRFVSLEPLLGSIDLDRKELLCVDWRRKLTIGTYLDWVIVGGESGQGARPCGVPWIRSIVQQCKAARVPCFVKQLGANVIDRNDAGFDGSEPSSWPEDTETDDWHLDSSRQYQGADARIILADRKGGNPSEWPEDLRAARESPGGAA